MSLYKRKDSPYWWIKLTIPGHAPVQESTRTANKRQAREYEKHREAELWRELKLGDKPRHTWEEAVLRYLEETTEKRDHHGDRQRLAWLHPYLEGHRLDTISRDQIDRIMAQRPELKPASINRYLATIRAILRKAQREWGWLDAIPTLRLREEPKRRVRWITQEEATRLLAELPEHVASMAEFSLATGLRLSNVTGLRWNQIDLGRRIAWIHADQNKSKKDLSVPLNDNATEVLRQQWGQHPEFVFNYAGHPIKRPDILTWQRACQKAGITDFRWHDLRHTWASWHVQAGTSLQTLMELGGWSSYDMVLRYAHLAGEHLQSAAGNIVTIQLRCEKAA